jgi:hypothetical protein
VTDWTELGKLVDESLESAKARDEKRRQALSRDDWTPEQKARHADILRRVKAAKDHCEALKILSELRGV